MSHSEYCRTVIAGYGATASESHTVSHTDKVVQSLKRHTSQRTLTDIIIPVIVVIAVPSIGLSCSNLHSKSNTGMIAVR